MVEHGHTFGIMHENYVDYVSSCETLAQISDSFSNADMIDSIIYTDVSWDLIQYFNISACLIPAQLIKKDPHKTSKSIRPGSIWTKYSNACMKANRLKRLKFNRDCIHLIVQYLNIDGKSPVHFDSYDLDSINQLSFSEKIKPKVLSNLKALLKK